MSEPSAHKYLCSGKFPSKVKRSRMYCTCTDAFAWVWEEYLSYPEDNPSQNSRGVLAKRVFTDDHMNKTRTGAGPEAKTKARQNWRKPLAAILFQG